MTESPTPDNRTVVTTMSETSTKMQPTTTKRGKIVVHNNGSINNFTNDRRIFKPLGQKVYGPHFRTMREFRLQR